MIFSENTIVVGNQEIWTKTVTKIGPVVKTFDQVMRRLFSNNEQGFAYDPNDLSTLYQDAAGTIPVTGVGQPVGLMLDISKNLRIGVNLVPQESFASGTTGWTLQSQWTLIDGKVVCTGSTSLLLNNTKLVIGKRYRITIDALRTSESGTLSVRNGSSSASQIAVTDAKSKTVIEVNVPVAESANPHFYFLSQGWVGEISSIRIEEVSGNHATQTVAASQPILRRNATTGANYLEFDGVDDFLLTSSVDFSATAAISLFIGCWKLRTTAIYEYVMGNGSVVSQLGVVMVALTHTNTLTEVSSNNGTYINLRPAIVIADNTPLLYSYQRDATRSILKVAGTTNQSNVAGNATYADTPFYIGRRAAGAQWSAQMHLYSMIAISRATTTDETLPIEKAIAKSTGVTLNV